ncbi:LysM domain-containing protein [Colletotrichum viniferum]|nr:LysM domain-containing protein [Colletotrichum viniferum]
MLLGHVFVAFVELLPLSYAFNLWRLVDAEGLSNVLQIPTGCLTDVTCDQDLFQRTVNVDGLWWTQEDVSTLCTSSCLNSAQNWKDNVDEVCVGEFMVQGDRMVEVETLAARFVEGLGLSCLRSSSGQWCFVEQQEWTGSDIITPDCAANPSDPCLYDDELLCSECFLNLMYKRVTSDFLADTDHSDYLVNEFQDIQDISQTTVGELATRVPPHPSTTQATATATATAVPNPDPDCELGQWVDIFATPESALAETDLERCNELAELHGIATGDLMVTTRSSSCTMEPEGPLDDEDSDEGWFCGSPACQLLRVNEGDTCDSIAAAVSNYTNPITAVRLATWNPNVLGACDFLVPNYLPILENPTSPPANVQEGIAPGCNRYVQANSTIASCWKIANDGGISQARLFELNPVLGESGERCDTQVWLGYYYCVRTTGEGPTTTAPPATTSVPTPEPTAVPTPSPIHEGTTPNCNKWAEAQDGDYCWKMANDAGIELSSFYEWNTVLANGDSCDMIWPGAPHEYYGDGAETFADAGGDSGKLQ